MQRYTIFVNATNFIDIINVVLNNFYVSLQL